MIAISVLSGKKVPVPIRTRARCLTYYYLIPVFKQAICAMYNRKQMLGVANWQQTLHCFLSTQIAKQQTPVSIRFKHVCVRCRTLHDLAQKVHYGFTDSGSPVFSAC